jgi:hypothetical protein
MLKRCVNNRLWFEVGRTAVVAPRAVAMRANPNLSWRFSVIPALVRIGGRVSRSDARVHPTTSDSGRVARSGAKEIEASKRMG